MSVDSGTIRLDGEIIRYRSKTYGNWDLPLADVRVIGESTSDLGPFVDDYFLCFAIAEDTWYEASFCAAGWEEFSKALTARLGDLSPLRLNNCTDIASNVLWPASLSGKPMFEYAEASSERWLARVLGFKSFQQCFAPAVTAFLQGKTPA